MLECIRQGQVGGGESHLLSLSTNLNKDVFEPIVLSFTDGPMIDMLKREGIETHIIFTEKPFNLFVWRKVKKLMREKEIDIVHAHGTRANSNVFWAAKFLHIPLIYTIHGWSFHDDQKQLVKKFRILGEKFLTSRTDVNISVSESNQHTGKKHIKSFTSLVVNNGIDQEKFNPAKKFTDIRKELAIDKNDTVLLFIARFTVHKQPLTLIRAFASVVKKIPTIKLVMVGDGDEKKTAHILAKELSLEENIIFLPFRQDVPAILNAADIFILPSLWEGLPIGLLEAMSMGKAVIATKVDGTSDIVRHENNGHLINPDHIQSELAEAILLLATDIVLRQKYGVNAIETITSHFNAANMTRQIEKIYTSLYK
ncbi:MAG TPA: glycosyltransferase family 4 protein [Chitinophagaceae bacterium]|nr:glycosyltransferase family 4 protein [Chitinophagaceae bacterium]